MAVTPSTVNMAVTPSTVNMAVTPSTMNMAVEETEAEGASAILEPLSLPLPPRKADHFQFSPWEPLRCQCILCDNEFQLPEDRDFLISHIYYTHELLIVDYHKIKSWKGYLDYWRFRFSQEPATDICIQTKDVFGNIYFQLSDFIHEDCVLRKELLNKRLEWILDFQVRERQDTSFVKGCLFCRHVEKGSRVNYLTHLSYHHNFQFGRPDSIVFIDKLIEKIEDKLNKLMCIYCEHIFKDRNVLKEHMRKRFHKRINPRNTDYDPFYVVNYLPEGRGAVDEEETSDDPWAPWREEGSDWWGWEEEPTPIVCLFCLHTCGKWEDILEHMNDEHGFSYKVIMSRFNFYEQVKMVNYIRKEVYLCRCYKCRMKFPTLETLLGHMNASKHFVEPDKENWDQPEFFFPTYENDTFLCLLEDNEDDPFEELSANMIMQCTMKGNTPDVPGEHICAT